MFPFEWEERELVFGGEKRVWVSLKEAHNGKERWGIKEGISMKWLALFLDVLLVKGKS